MRDTYSKRYQELMELLTKKYTYVEFNGNVVDLYDEEHHNLENHIRLILVGHCISITGDYGCWIFGSHASEIVDPTTFFQGNHINPDYWREKCTAECTHSHIVENHFDPNEVERLFRKTVRHDYGKSEDEVMDNLFEDFDYADSEDRIYAAVEEGCKDLELSEYSSDIAHSIVCELQEYSNHFIYICHVLQWVENKYRDQLEQIFLENW